MREGAWDSQQFPQSLQRLVAAADVSRGYCSSRDVLMASTWSAKRATPKTSCRRLMVFYLSSIAEWSQKDASGHHRHKQFNLPISARISNRYDALMGALQRFRAWGLAQGYTGMNSDDYRLWRGLPRILLE